VPIPESQLDTWSHQGAVATSSSTYQTIKSVLEADGTPYANKAFAVFLQGSYGNDTNIWAESDVDIVIRLDSTFISDVSDLSEAQKALYQKTVATADYSYWDFKRDVLQVLKDKYGDHVTSGDKAIAIAASGSRRKADVIVALEYRRYYQFDGTYNPYTSGICFYNSTYQLISNFPKQHSENLTTKHQATNSMLKPMVRIYKNLRGRCISEKLLPAGVAPSYYLEGLLYNVPRDKFTTQYQSSFVNAINWLQQEANKDELVCANEQFYLLRDGLHTCWNRAHCEMFLKAAVDLWNGW
jgi:hypothetical protein